MVDNVESKLNLIQLLAEKVDSGKILPSEQANLIKIICHEENMNELMDGQNEFVEFLYLTRCKLASLLDTKVEKGTITPQEQSNLIKLNIHTDKMILLNLSKQEVIDLSDVIIPDEFLQIENKKDEVLNDALLIEKELERKLNE